MILLECNHIITDTKAMLTTLVDAEIIGGGEAQELLTMLVREQVKNEFIEH